MANLYSAKNIYPELLNHAQSFIGKFTATAAITGEVKKLDGDNQFEAFGKLFELKFSMVRNPVERLRIDFLGEIRAYMIIETEAGTTEKKHLTCIWFDRHENSTELLKKDCRLHITLTEDDTVNNFTQVLLNGLLDSDQFKAYGEQDIKALGEHSVSDPDDLIDIVRRKIDDEEDQQSQIKLEQYRNFRG